jgi:serine/threonine protein kinase
VKYEEFCDDEHDCYILSEYVCGETLAQKIKSNPEYFNSRANLDKFFNQLLDALRCLHENHVVYSDLKPENIMLTQVGNDVKLIDLGYCFANSYTNTAGTTEGYSAPEQENKGKLDITTDIYGVGKIIEYIGLNIPSNLPNIYSKIMQRCLKERQRDRIQNTDEIVRLINKRKHTIRNTIIVAMVCVALFFVVRTIMYSEVFNSWWNSFELVAPHVEYDVEETSTLYSILSKKDGTCEVVGHKTNPNVYIVDSVEIKGKKYRVTHIADEAFVNKKYIRSVHIAEGVQSIGERAFRDCSNLITVNLPNSITKIGTGAFFDNNKLSYLKLSSSLTEIGRGAFAGIAIDRITVPEGVTRLELDLLGNNANLKYVTLPSTLTKIERGVFWNCPELEEITIPENVTTIGEYCFFGCDKLTDIYNLSSTPQNIPPIHRNPSQITLHVPAGSVEAYRNAPYWQDMNIVED